MKQFQYTITDLMGLHARPAGQLAKAAKPLNNHYHQRRRQVCQRGQTDGRHDPGCQGRSDSHRHGGGRR